MKSILFVINTMGIGGGEKALLELMKHMDLNRYKVFLFIVTGQGELISQIPERVILLNKKYYPISVLDKSGKRRLIRTVLRSMLCRKAILGRMKYILDNIAEMIKKRSIRKEKLLWKILSDGAQRLDQEYDLAVAYLEGGATYYVDAYVKAKRKAAFIHIDYIQAGYSRMLDENCYLNFDRVFTVSENVRKSFLTVYPECAGCTEVFYNLIDRAQIIDKAKEKGGFSDSYEGFRILTVGRLVPQKALNVAIDTMRILKTTGRRIRWYVLGEGQLRRKLEEQIAENGLEEDFILMGTADNPYPYYAQCDLYVHTARFEGKSIAVEEAQILGCAVLVSDYEGAREQVESGVDGIICRLDPTIMASEILHLVKNPWILEKYGASATERQRKDNGTQVGKLTELLDI